MWQPKQHSSMGSCCHPQEMHTIVDLLTQHSLPSFFEGDCLEQHQHLLYTFESHVSSAEKQLTLPGHHQSPSRCGANGSSPMGMTHWQNNFGIIRLEENFWLTQVLSAFICFPYLPDSATQNFSYCWQNTGCCQRSESCTKPCLFSSWLLKELSTGA